MLYLAPVMFPRYRLLIVLFSILCFPVLAQQKDLVLNGYLGLEGAESFSFRLVLKDSSGTVNGYSYTWLNEKQDAKSSITGKVDKKAKTFSFKEGEIVYNNGFKSSATLCLINATLKYIPDGSGGFALSGPITSNDAGQASCSRGTLIFPHSPALVSLFADESLVAPPQNAATSVVKKPAVVKVVYDTARSTSNRATVAPQVPKITQGRMMEYEWNTDTVILDVWDGSTIDGDVITISFNSKPVLANYTLAKEKKRLAIPLSEAATDTLAIQAIREGNEPPTTADISLIDGSKRYSLVAYNAIGKKAYIIIRRKRKQ